MASTSSTSRTMRERVVAGTTAIEHVQEALGKAILEAVEAADAQFLDIHRFGPEIGYCLSGIADDLRGAASGGSDYGLDKTAGDVRDLLDLVELAEQPSRGPAILVGDEGSRRG